LEIVESVSSRGDLAMEEESHKEDDGGGEVEGPFLWHHWVWQHMQQRKEQNKFLELCELVKDRKKEHPNLFKSDLSRLVDAWHFVAQVSIVGHR